MSLFNKNDFKIIGEQVKTDKVTVHGYDRFYNKEFEIYRNIPSIGILEIGVQNGESLQLWKQYFNHAFIYGVDIDIEKSDDRSTIFKIDQSKIDELQTIKNRINHEIYVINDDGSHIPEHQLLSFDYLFSNILEEGGVYIIEDIETSYWKRGSIYSYNTEYGLYHKSSIIEVFKKLVDYVNINFLSDEDKKSLDLKTNFISSKTKNSILSINFSTNCIIIKKKSRDDYNFHNPYYYTYLTSNEPDKIEPDKIDPDKEQIIIVRKTDTDGIGNVLKCFINGLCITNNCVIECNPTYVYGNYDTILDKTQVYTEENKQNSNLLYIYTCRLLVFRDEEDEQQNIYNEFQHTNGIGNDKLNSLFSFTKLIDWNYESEKIIPRIKTRVFDAINRIKFNPYIINEVINFAINNIDDKTIAISIRTWRSNHENNIDRKYSFEVYEKQILETINNYNINNIIISIDNIDYINEYIELFDKLKIKHHILRKQNYQNELQFAIYKMLILSKCNFLIGNRISTFTELIYWFSLCKIKVFTVF